METAEGDTRRRLRIIERQIVSRAERMTVTECVKRRQPRRGASSWTRADERLFSNMSWSSHWPVAAKSTL